MHAEPQLAANPAEISGDAGSWLTWSDGKCEGDVYQVLGPGDSASAYGWVGPDTATEVRRIEIYADWDGKEDVGRHAGLVSRLPNRATPSE